MSALRVSSLGQCTRRVYYSHTGVEEIVTEEQARLMGIGKALERLRIRELKESGVRVQGRQMEVSFGRARGHLDGLIQSEEGPELLEIKSTSQYSIKNWTRQSLPRTYAFQVHAYASGLALALGEPVSRIRMDVIDRVSGECHVWRYEVDPAVTQAARERADLLSRILESGQAPEPEFESSSAACRSCPFRKTCRPDAVPHGASNDIADASEWIGWLEALAVYQSGVALRDEGEGLMTRARDALQTALAAHNVTKARADGIVVSWTSIETSRLDSKELQRQFPELYTQFLKPSIQSRFDVRT